MDKAVIHHQSKRVLITGAGGFVGTSLCHYSSCWDDDVEIIATSRRHVFELQEKFPACQVVEWDVMTEPESALLEGVDTIIHLATANNILCGKDPEKALALSVFGTKNVIKQAKVYGVKKFIHVSTIQVYGSELTGVIDEETSVCPENDYALFHRYAEQVVEQAQQKSELTTCIVRLANSVGQYYSNTVDRWSLVPACFCQEAGEHEKITLRSSGKQMRNFVPMADVTEVIRCLISLEKNQWPDKLNLAAAENYRIIDMAYWVKQQYETRFGKPITLTSTALPLDSNDFKLCQQRLSKIGFNSKFSTVSDGLKQEINKIVDTLLLNNRKPCLF